MEKGAVETSFPVRGEAKRNGQRFCRLENVRWWGCISSDKGKRESCGGKRVAISLGRIDQAMVSERLD